MDQTRRKRVAVFILAILFIGMGVFRGENIDVFRKASMICYECIGIG